MQIVCYEACNFITKVSRRLDLDLSRLCRDVWTHPQIIFLWLANWSELLETKQ
ncbi:MAG: hypothetical protein WBA93_02510 [Microcoleaceae cyanobacterium]